MRLSESAQIVNRFMGMMHNWFEGRPTSYFMVRITNGWSFLPDDVYDVEVTNTKWGYYTAGWGYDHRK